MTIKVIGRTRERRAIADAMHPCLIGHRRSVVVAGEPGIGKSVLLTDAVERLHEHGFVVFATAAQEIERHRPFGVVRRALGAALDGPRWDLPNFEWTAEPGVRGLVDLPELGFQLIDGITDLVATIAGDGPVAFVIDDAQWADEASVQVLAALHERLHDQSLLQLVATRSFTGASALSRFIAALYPEDLIELGPLDWSDVELFVAELTGGPPSTSELELVRRASGNPLFIATLLAATDASGRSDDLPASVRRLVAQTVEQLDDDATRLLELMAVLGRPADAATIAGCFDRSVSEVLGPTRALIESGLLVDSDAGISFRHDVVRDAVYDSLQPTLRSGLHLTVGRRLLALTGRLDDVVTHFSLGARSGDVESADVLRRAATEIARVAPNTAAQLWERTLEILPAGHPDREAAMVELAQAYVFCDRLDDSLRLIDEAMQRGLNHSLEIELRNARTQVFFLRGQPRRAAAEFEHIVTHDPGGEREPVALADAAISAMFAVDLERAGELADRSISSSDSGRWPHQPLAHAVLAWLASLSGDLEGGIARSAHAVELADRMTGLEGHRRIPHLFHAQCLLWADRVEEAVSSLRRGRRLSADLGMGWDEPMYHALAADERIRAAEWGDALAEVEAGLRRSKQVGSHFADSWLLIHRAKIELWCGDLDVATSTLDAAHAGLAGSGGQGADQLWWLRAMIAALVSPDEAVAMVAVLWARLDDLGVVLRELEFAPDVVAIALRAGERSLAETVARRVDELADARPTMLGRTARTHVRGLLDDRVDLLESASNGYRQRAHPVEALRAACDAALAESPERSRDRRAIVASSAATLGAPGVQRWYFGEIVSATPTRSTGWENLTRSEVAVVEMVGRGMSNAEIAEALSISRRTVESHLYHAYPKLGLSSRVELAIEASQRQATPDTDRGSG